MPLPSLDIEPSLSDHYTRPQHHNSMLSLTHGPRPVDFGLSSILSPLSSPRRLKQIQRPMRLPLVMGFVPDDDLQGLSNVDSPLFQGWGNRGQIFFSQLREGLPQMFTRLG